MQRVDVKPVEYLKQLDEAIEEDRTAHGKRELKPKASEPATKEIKVSRTDADSGYMVRDGKPKGFFYLDHRTVDGRHAIITDTHVTPANVHDSIPYLGRLDRQRERFGFQVRAVGLDAGYSTAAIAKGLEDRNIYAVIGYRRGTTRRVCFKRQFRYEQKRDVYVCPNRQLLITAQPIVKATGSTTPIAAVPRVFDAAQCTRSRNCTKIVTRHVWQDSRDRIDQHRLSRRARASTNEGRKRWNEASPTPNNYMDTATPECVASARAAAVSAGSRRAKHQENRPADEPDGAKHARFTATDASIGLYPLAPPLPDACKYKQRLKLNSFTEKQTPPK